MYVLQKKTVRIITFSKFDEYSNPLFKQLGIIKLFDLVTLSISVFMYKFHNKLLYLLPSILSSHVLVKHNIRAASKQSFYLPKARTNYGKFNIRFQGSKIWNLINHKNKSFSLKSLRKRLKTKLFANIRFHINITSAHMY